jgi:ribosome recycling factor
VADPNIEDIRRRMKSAVEVVRKEFAGLRTGRASAALLEPVVVDAYGSKMPIGQVGNIGVPDPRLLTVQVWDTSLVKAVEKAIREAGLGLNPQTEGTLIRVPIPALSQERRAELAKVANRYAEQSKVAVRNVRRDGMDLLKRMEKDGDVTKDEHKARSDEIQKLTDLHIKEIDTALRTKESEIMQV